MEKIISNRRIIATIASISLALANITSLSLPASATPNAPTISAAGGNEIIGVQVQASDTGPVPTSYSVSASPGSSTCTINVPNNYCNLTGLTNGSKYTVTVIAVRDGNNSAPATATASPRAAVYTLSVTNNLVDQTGECQTFTTDAPSSVLATWSGDDGIIGSVGPLGSFSLCPPWEWYAISDTALNLTLTLWHAGTPVSSGQTLAAVQETYTPFASATALYSPDSGGGGVGEEDGGGDPSGSYSSTLVNYFIAEGFSKGQSKLSKGMKSFIRKELDSVSKFSKVVCTGTVRGKKWTESRQALAIARATSACDYVTELYPDVDIELKKRLMKMKKQDSLTVRISVFNSRYVAPPA